MKRLDSGRATGVSRPEETCPRLRPRGGVGRGGGPAEADGGPAPRGAPKRSADVTGSDDGRPVYPGGTRPTSKAAAPNDRQPLIS